MKNMGAVRGLVDHLAGSLGGVEDALGGGGGEGKRVWGRGDGVALGLRGGVGPALKDDAEA